MKEVISIKYEWSTLNCAKIMHLEQNSKFARCQNPYQLQTLNILLTFQEYKNPHGQNVWGLNIFYLKRQGYCVCVKYIILCNCLCSSSSCFSASFTQNIREFEAKNYFTDHSTAIKICSFRDSVPVHPFSTWFLQGYAKISSNFPFLFKRYNTIVC